MRGERDPRKRKLSAGSVIMLAMLAIVLAGSALVLGRLSSGASVDLSKLSMDVLNLQDKAAESVPQESPGGNGSGGTAATTEAPAATEAPAENPPGKFTLTIGGSVAITGEVRKNSWSADSKVSDFSDMMMLLASELRANVNIVFVENILSDDHKISDIVAPASAAGLLKESGFDMAACGYGQAYAQGKDGVETTLMSLTERHITPVGLRYADASDNVELFSFGRVRTAVLQYTATIASKTRKAMEKEGTAGMVPEAETERISREIEAARRQGAEAVIVLLNWGKNATNPDKKQRELAESIAMCGADLIVGNGSHTPQSAEYLAGAGGKEVLCVWSLGSLLCGDRSNIARLSGYLLHVTIRSDGQGGAEILDPEYTPVYTWKYKQDSRFYYRCIVSDTDYPDGMDSEQQKYMTRSAETVAKALQGSPVKRRGQADAD